MAIAMQLCGITPSGCTKEDIDKAAEKLKEQKPLLKKYVMDQVFTEMENSQAAIAPYYAGDVVTMYNGDAGEGWVIQTPDSWSTGSWTGGANGITCNQSGTFDVYCKMIYQRDNIYFGAAA